MSLWTPSGEHPVDDQGRTQASSGPRPGAGPEPDAGREPGAEPEPDVEALQRQLADAPADVVVANHCYGLFELAAVYLSHTPPRLDGARLAIDALGALVDGLGARLGDAHAPLRDGLAQIRLAYVQISAAAAPPGDGAAAPPGDG